MESTFSTCCPELDFQVNNIKIGLKQVVEKKISITFLGPSFVDCIIEFYHKSRIEENQNKVRAVLITQREREGERACPD